MDKRDLESASDDHIKAVEMLLKVHNEDQEAADYRFELGRNYWALGRTLQESGIQNEAGQAYTLADKYLKPLAKEHSDVTEYTVALALNYASVASLQQELDESASALGYQRGAVAFLKEIAEQGGNHRPSTPRTRGPAGLLRGVTRHRQEL